MGVSCWMSDSASRAPGVFRWPGFVLFWVSCRCVIEVVLLGLERFARLIRTPITICSESFHLLLLEFDILVLRPHLNHWSFKYHGVERPNLQGVSCRPRFECGMTCPILCLTPKRWMVQCIIGCFPELCFLEISVAPKLVELHIKFINYLVFHIEPILFVLIITILK